MINEALSINQRSPLSVVFLSPELVAGFVHEHAVFKEENIEEPGDEEDQREDEEELPVGPGNDRDEHCDEEEIKERAL